MTNMEYHQKQQRAQQPQEQQQPSNGKHQRIQLSEINPYLTCQLCKGYLIDATTISECLHSFCRSCIIKFLRDKSHCPVCEVLINKAKPNLKLDKTLQDVIYKLVPELFLSEMCRRQEFYQQHPDQATRVSPEHRGEDTERTIFNPRDVFSLSIEYISDDSTPGAILLPSSKPNIEANRKNGTQKETENMIRRFLQCPGMCRVDVLKKFVRNKYNVDTNRFHIDILYKRVPLPDHYTLIDIAYIYSWKRNEPMKFFFRITDIRLAKQRFDYLEPTSSLDIPHQAPMQVKQPEVTYDTSQTTNNTVVAKPSDKVAEETEKLKDQIKNGSSIATKNPVYTNITLNRSNNVEIITKIQKVSNKNGQPIGLNIIKQTVKKPNRSIEKKSEARNKTTSSAKKNFHDRLGPGVKANASDKNGDKFGFKKLELKVQSKTQSDKSRTNGVKTDSRNNGGLKPKSIEVMEPEVKVGAAASTRPDKVTPLKFESQNMNVATSKSEVKIDPFAPKFEVKVNSKSESQKVKVDLPSPKSEHQKSTVIGLPEPQKVQSSTLELDVEKERFLKSIELTARNVLDGIVQTQKKEIEAAKTAVVLKRKLPSPQKHEKLTKKIKLEKKAPGRKLKTSPFKDRKAENLKTLLNTCKIPSSLSITCVNGDHETQIKPVINHIEIVKLPEPKMEIDEDKQKLELEKVGTTMQPAGLKEDDKQKIDAKSELSITITIENSADGVKKEPIKAVGLHPNLPKMLGAPVGVLAKTSSSRSSFSFQKMFEEAIRRPESSTQKLYPVKSKMGDVSSAHKRNILEIASQLCKKTRLEQEKNASEKDGKVPIPRLNKTLNKSISSSNRGKSAVGKSKKDSPLQTVANLHSSSLGMNYSVSVDQNSDTRLLSPTAAGLNYSISVEQNGLSEEKAEESPKVRQTASPKPSNERLCLKLPSPKPPSLASPKITTHPNSSPRSQSSPRPFATSPKPFVSSPQPQKSPGLAPAMSSKPPPFSPKNSSVATASKAIRDSPKISTALPKLSKPPKPSVATPKSQISPKDARPTSRPQPNSNIDPNQLLENYNIPTLAQLTANFNLNPSALGLPPALQQALRYLELQNRQNWLSMNSNPLVQYEKYLQSLGPNGQNHLLGNIKEN